MKQNLRTVSRGTASGPRIAALLLTGMLAAVSIVASPATGTAAHADTGIPTAQLDVSITPVEDSTLALTRGYEYADGTVFNLHTKAPDRDTGFKIVPNADGSFRLINDTSNKCVDVSGPDRTYPGDLNESDCNGGDPQNWYLQPIGDAPADSERYVIRHVGDNKCMAPTTTVSRAAGVGIRDCDGSETAQQWLVTSGAEDAKLRTLATTYALSQFNNKSSVIPTATYKIDSDTTATIAPLVNASMTGDGLSRNGTAGIVKRTGNWTTSNSSTMSVGFDYGLSSTVTVGGGALPMEASLTVAWTFKFNKEWNNTETVGGGYEFEVNPGAYGWVMRGQLMKSVTGTWTLTNDMGKTWTGTGTANVAVPDGTDGQNSLTVQCTSDGNDPDCLAHSPAKP